MKASVRALLALLLPCAFALAQGRQPGKTELIVIRGKVMGLATASPALQKEIQAKYGAKPAPDPKVKGPNAQVGKNGFAYVSPHAEGRRNR